MTEPASEMAPRLHMPWLMYFRNLELLDVTEERRLARRYRATRDPRIAERLVRAHLRLVIMIARHYRFTTLKPTPLQLDGEVITTDAATPVCVDIAEGALATLG